LSQGKKDVLPDLEALVTKVKGIVSTDLQRMDEWAGKMQLLSLKKPYCAMECVRQGGKMQSGTFCDSFLYIEAEKGRFSG